MSATTAGPRDFAPIPTEKRALLVVHSVDPGAIGRRLPLDGSSWELGREARGPGGFEDARMSRSHAKVEIDPDLGGYAIVDLGSRNGTFLDGARISEPEPLSTGQVVSLGDTLLVVDAEPPKHAFPAAPDADGALASAILGDSFATIHLRRAIATIARAGGSVLILGESGVGKEVAAREIHRLSGRTGALVPINCAAIPSELVESELFGHKKGAFTGATEDRDGYFVMSSNGTLFLDEIGELPGPMQAKLLRVLEEGAVLPVGGGASKKVDLRVVAATQADISSGGFRSDLYARLGDWILRIPPLRDRRADVLALWHHFADPLAGAHPCSAEFAEALLLHGWPLNAREVRQLARRLSAIAKGERIWDLPLLPPEMQGPVRIRASRESAAPDRAAIEAALASTKGNVLRASEQLGCDRKSLYRWMRRAGIDPARFRG